MAVTAWQVDPVAWKLEVERVAPKLRVAVAPDMRDWRQHLEAAHTHMATLKTAWPDVRCDQPAMEDQCLRQHCSTCCVVQCQGHSVLTSIRPSRPGGKSCFNSFPTIHH